jgi:hypothetical protein
MDAKEKINIPCDSDSHCQVEFINGFNKATKAAEPLLDEIVRLNVALKSAFNALELLTDEKWEGLNCFGHVNTADCIQSDIKEALSSSAHVVETYRKNVLGE